MGTKSTPLEYHSRYSDTDTPDKFGRWARIVTYKNLRVGWINKTTIHDKTIFTVNCYFPQDNSDISPPLKCETLEEAKEIITEKWVWFKDIIKNDNH